MVLLMRRPPRVPRAIAFFDGQNLFHAAREAFGYEYPNYDPFGLAEAVCDQKGWHLCQVRFYTGLPDPRYHNFWHAFWQSKLDRLRARGAFVFTRPLRYRKKRIALPDGSVMTSVVGQEKGIDVRIALDIIALAHRNAYDVALVFSQDQDLAEAAEEVRVIAREQGRWIKIASAFPVGPGSRNLRGIDKTDWIRIERVLYDQCLDARNDRAKGE